MPLVRFIPNSEIEAEKAKGTLPFQPDKKEVFISNISAHLDTKWQKAKRARQEIDNRLIKNIRARKCEYEPVKLAAIRQMMGADYDPVYMAITETKCRAAEAWIKDIIFQPGQRPWDLSPTPLPDLPEKLKEQIEQKTLRTFINMAIAESARLGVQPNIALVSMRVREMLPLLEEKMVKAMKEFSKQAAERMKEKIDDQFLEGKWEKAVGESIYDIVTHGNGFVKGPLMRREPVLTRDYNDVSKTWGSKVGKRILPRYQRRSPFNIYPSPDSTCIDDGWLFDKITLTRRELSELIGVKGYDDDAIREVLQAHRDGGLHLWTDHDQEKADLEDQQTISIHETENIDCLEYMGSLQGSLLREWGLSKRAVPDEEKEYDVIVWKIASWVIKVMLNPHPLGKKPMSKAGFVENPDTFWDKGVPEIIEHVQTIGNAAARAIVVNTAMAQGPQVEVNEDRLPAGSDLSIYPLKVWRTTNQGMMEGKAVNFYGPDLIVNRLIDLYEFCLKAADEDSGVPRYAHSAEGPTGTGDTASGLSMLMSQAAKGIKNVIKNIDNGLIIPSVESQYYHNLRFEGDDEKIMGDLKVVAKGSSSLKAKEQQIIRRTEFLRDTNNPTDVQITGLQGRAEMMRENLQALEIDPDKIIGEEEQIDAMAMQMQAGNFGSQNANPQILGPDGRPVGGQDERLFESKPGVTQ